MALPDAARDDEAVEALEREYALVGSAIAMVRSGASPRVHVSGLRFGLQMIDSARSRAGREGLRAVPLWTADGALDGIAIERPVRG